MQNQTNSHFGVVSVCMFYFLSSCRGWWTERWLCCGMQIQQLWLPMHQNWFSWRVKTLNEDASLVSKSTAVSVRVTLRCLTLTEQEPVSRWTPWLTRSFRRLTGITSSSIHFLYLSDTWWGKISTSSQIFHLHFSSNDVKVFVFLSAPQEILWAVGAERESSGGGGAPQQTDQRGSVLRGLRQNADAVRAAGLGRGHAGQKSVALLTWVERLLGRDSSNVLWMSNGSGVSALDTFFFFWHYY